MKKFTFLALLSVLTLSAIAQNKFGYIDAQEILLLMPEYKAAGTELESFAKSLEAFFSNSFTAGPFIKAVGFFKTFITADISLLL